jgi:predicted transcriptional regulator
MKDRVTITLSEDSIRNLDRLAKPLGGNRSAAVEQAIDRVAEIERLQRQLRRNPPQESQ